MKKLGKIEAKDEIEKFFKNLKNQSPNEIKKMKRVAMKHNIKLGPLKKKFCKKCFSPDLKVKSIKNKVKTIECKNCGTISRWKLR